MSVGGLHHPLLLLRQSTGFPSYDTIDGDLFTFPEAELKGLEEVVVNDGREEEERVDEEGAGAVAEGVGE